MPLTQQRYGDAYEVSALIQRHGLDVVGPHAWKGGQSWTFRTSPLCEHHDDGPFIIQHANGAIAASCYHNLCKWTWADLRQRLEPRAESRKHQSHSDAPNDNPFREAIRYQRITSAELAGGDYALDYFIENAMVAAQPLIIAGPQKAMKTSFAIDAAISLAAGGCWLGKFRVPEPRRVVVMTGESGLATIQETAIRICSAAGLWLHDLNNLFWSPDLPRFGDPAHLEALEQFLLGDMAEVLVVDPVYLCMPSADAGNVFAQGELLRDMSSMCTRLGVMLVVAHHTKKNTGRDPHEPLELQDIAWSGFAEFARQWWLINMREAYEAGTGDHKLWLSVGGSAGHGGLWGVDVFEGARTATPSRCWQVAVRPAAEVRDDAESV